MHILKLADKYIMPVMVGTKCFEIRKDDRDYKLGDVIHFVQENGNDILLESFTLFKITYILRDVSKYGLQDGYCILGIRRLVIGDING